MAIVEPSSQLSPREAYQMEYEKEMFDKQAAFQLDAKRLELEVAKIEARWSVLLKLPLVIIKLPVYVLFACAYIISVAKGKELSEHFWEFIKK